MPAVSIVIPVYNLEKYLERCVLSVLKQTFQDYELILVDDGSTDSSGRIADRLAEKDSRICVIHKKNAGVSAARNTGILKACGTYITMIDGDDTIHPQFLERMVELLTENHADMCVGRIKRISSETEIDSDQKLSDQSECISSAEALGRYAEAHDDRNYSSVAKMTRTDICKNNLYPTDRTWAEDTAAVYTWYAASEKIIEIPDLIYYYWQNEGSISHSIPVLRRFEEFRTWEEKLDYFKNAQYEKAYIHTYNGYRRAIAKIIPRIQEDQTLNDAEKKKYTQQMRRKLRSMIKSDIPYSNKMEKLLCCNQAFPKTMHVYWFLLNTRNKLLHKHQ